MKSYRGEVSHMFNQSLTLSHDLLKLSSFNLHTNLPLVNWSDSSLFFNRTALTHTELAELFGPGVSTTIVHIITSNSPNINPVDYAIWQYHFTSPLWSNINQLKQHLLVVWYVIKQSIESAVNEWRMSLPACLQLKEEILSKYCNNINNWLNQEPTIL